MMLTNASYLNEQKFGTLNFSRALWCFFWHILWLGGDIHAQTRKTSRRAGGKRSKHPFGHSRSNLQQYDWGCQKHDQWKWRAIQPRVINACRGVYLLSDTELMRNDKYENIFLKKKPFLFLKRKKEGSWLFGRFSLWNWQFSSPCLINSHSPAQVPVPVPIQIAGQYDGSHVQWYDGGFRFC